ncbi:hypothetical protein B0H19DRAFT_1096703 [Mycena capillaripes]|nr:hypothetical protein B0H19DRAFT_1096703 [Mycena capillaripes]
MGRLLFTRPNILTVIVREVDVQTGNIFPLPLNSSAARVPSKYSIHTAHGLSKPETHRLRL